jgi:hypothetical protein
MLCSLLKAKLTFWRSRLHLKGQRKGKQETSLFFDPEDGGYMFFQNISLIFNELQGVILQRIELFITTTARRSIHPNCILFEEYQSMDLSQKMSQEM